MNSKLTIKISDTDEGWTVQKDGATVVWVFPTLPRALKKAKAMFEEGNEEGQP